MLMLCNFREMDEILNVCEFKDITNKKTAEGLGFHVVKNLAFSSCNSFGTFSIGLTNLKDARLLIDQFRWFMIFTKKFKYLPHTVFPIFCGCYLELLRLESTSKATQLLVLTSKFIKEVVPEMVPCLETVAKVKTLKDLYLNKFLMDFIRSKFSVRCSVVESQILMEMLSDEKLFYMLTLLHHYVEFTIICEEYDNFDKSKAPTLPKSGDDLSIKDEPDSFVIPPCLSVFSLLESDESDASVVVTAVEFDVEKSCLHFASARSHSIVTAPLSRTPLDTVPQQRIGHTSLVYDILKFDNHILLSSDEDGRVLSWTDSPRPTVEYVGSDLPVWTISSNSFHFSTACADACVRLYDPQRVHPLRILAGHSADVQHTAFHPNGAYLASASTDCTIRVYDLGVPARSVRVFGPLPSAVFRIFFIDSATLVSVCENRSIYLFDLVSSQTLVNGLTMTGSPAFITSATLHMPFLVVGTSVGNIQSINIQQVKKNAMVNLAGELNPTTENKTPWLNKRLSLGGDSANVAAVQTITSGYGNTLMIALAS